MGARRRAEANGANLTSTFNLPFSLYGTFLFCRGPYLIELLGLKHHIAQHGHLHSARNLQAFRFNIS